MDQYAGSNVNPIENNLSGADSAVKEQTPVARTCDMTVMLTHGIGMKSAHDCNDFRPGSSGRGSDLRESRALPHRGLDAAWATCDATCDAVCHSLPTLPIYLPII